jgi:hypothetical protein
MPDNHAIIIANSVSYGDTSKNIPASVVRSIASELSDNLINLGENSFKTPSTIVNATTDEARRLIRDKIRRATSSDMLLLYYFGHGVKSPNDELFFFFKDSDYLELPSMLDFDEITKWLRGYHIANVILVLDCCYAGIVREKLLSLKEFSGNYYLMASVTHRGKAEVDYGDKRPIGTFSKGFLESFTNPLARASFTRNVTLESLFKFVDHFTRLKSKQKPYCIDGGLANSFLFKQESVINIPSAIKESVSKKSTYRKLYVLLSFLAQAAFKSEDLFYKYMSHKGQREFLTPFQIKPGIVEYRFMGFSSFRRYIELGRDLGLIELGGLELTASGKLMIRNEGRKYNRMLLEAVTQLWKRHGIELSDIEDAIGARMKGNGIPSVEGIFFDMYLNKKITMSKSFFKILLDLTGNIGIIKYTRDPTYFLPTSFD